MEVVLRYGPFLVLLLGGVGALLLASAIGPLHSPATQTVPRKFLWWKLRGTYELQLVGLYRGRYRAGIVLVVLSICLGFVLNYLVPIPPHEHLPPFPSAGASA